jgi:small-conductance mechanosensitive channel
MTENVFFYRIKEFFNFTLFTVNQTPITFFSLVLFIFLFVAFLIISKIMTRTLGNRVLSRLNIDRGTRYNLERITQYILGIIGAIVAFQFIGIDLSGLAVIFGLLSVGIGFGLQNVTSNFVAGLILLIERPIKVGDRVSIGETEGDVLAINLRSTTIRSIDNIAIIVPNSDFISNSVTNWTYGDKKVRLNVEVGVSYNSDLEKVLRCLKEVAVENDKVLRSPEPEVHLTEFGDSSWNMRLRCWISDPKEHRRIASDLNCAIVHKFRENNVEIPFPQRDLHVRSSIPLNVSETQNS